jgi:glycosyltransferase involved in cell wall biosynthesis
MVVMKNSINLVIISHAYVYTPYREKIEALTKYQDLNITLITPEFGLEGGGQKVYTNPYQGKNYKHIILPGYFTGKLNFFIFKNLNKTLSEINPDIIMLEEEYWTQIAAQVTYVTKKFLPTTKLILLSQENICHIWENEAKSIYQKFRYSSFHLIEKFIIPKLDGLVFQFPEVWKDFEQRMLSLKFKGMKGTFPQLGVDYDRFAKPVSVKKLTSIREKLNLKQDTFVYGYVGRITQEKGIEDMIYALAGWNKPNTKVLIIGNGDTEYLEQLNQLIDKLNLNYIISIHQAIDFDDIPVYFQLLDISILLSHTTPIWKEQFGRVLVESMAAGTPVIGSDSGAIPLVIDKTGYIVLEKDILSIRETLLESYSNKAKYSKLSKLAQRRSAEKFSYTAIAEQTYNFIKKVLGV